MAGEWLIKKALKTAKTLTKKEAEKLDLPRGIKPPTKAQIKAQKAIDDEASYRATAEKFDYAPGENRNQFINPTADELDAIRATSGPYAGPVPKTMDPVTRKIPEKDIDSTAVGDILPPKGPRTRSQFALPRKAGKTTARVTDLMTNPAVKARIMEAAKAGESVTDWYDTTPLQAAFHEEFGPEVGQQRFEDYIGMVASTSTGNPIGPNIRTASNYYNQKYGGGRDAAVDPYIRKDEVTKRGRGESWEVPPADYGSHMQQTHQFNINSLAEGDLSAADNPKIAAFRENLLGNWTPTTIDKHAVRLGAMSSNDPRWLTPQGQDAMKQLQAQGMPDEQIMGELGKRATNWQDFGDVNTEYPAIEQYWGDIAKEMGITPAQLQAQAWVGGGQQTGLGSPGITFMDAFKDRIRRTAIRDNIAPEQVLKLMMRGKLTLAQLEPPAGQDTGSMIG